MRQQTKCVLLVLLLIINFYVWFVLYPSTVRKAEGLMARADLGRLSAYAKLYEIKNGSYIGMNNDFNENDFDKIFISQSGDFYYAQKGCWCVNSNGYLGEFDYKMSPNECQRESI